MEKKCTGCKRMLPREKFGRRKEASDGLQYKCTECRNKYKRKDYKKNKKHILRYQKNRRRMQSQEYGFGFY